jgi:hypothetical protein
VDLPDDAVVIRFRPTAPDSVLANAAKEARRTGAYRLSVFADKPRPGESQEDVIHRLLAASELAGIPADSNPKYYVCTQAAELISRNLTLWKDEDDDEVAEHYSVDLGDDPSVADAERFLDAFDEGRRR